MKSRSWIKLLALMSIAMALSTTAASAACQEFKKDKAAYKRCLAYERMAGTPTQRRDAQDQVKKDRARKNCSIVGPNKMKVCDDYKTRSERARDAAQKRANKGVDDKPLKPIVNTNSGAFGPPSTPSAARCRPGRVLSRTGQCVPG
jgi:hypothetical protein